tara:strand:+ start:142 stop:405 length:264 start_codon:yes stop_codon:yes gene_type:complete
MHIRLTCDISQEQIDCGYDLTLLAIHSRFCKWIVELDLSITHFAIFWETSEDGNPHLFATAQLSFDSPVEIDSKFLDEMHLGGTEDA